MIDRLRQMAIFAKTIDHGSFRGAANELKLSPSVVSHHISQLEEHLGVTLIYRSTRKLTLTTDGERLLAATRNMLEAVEDELLDISGTSRDPSGELRVTLPSALSQSKLTDAIAHFMEQYPRVRLTLDFSDSKKELIDHGFDVAIRFWLKRKKSPTTRKLFTVERVLVAAPNYLKTRPAITHPTDLQDWDWLALSPVHSRGVRFTKDEASVVKIKPNAHVFSNDVRSLYRLAANGLGVTTIPRFLAAQGVKENLLEYVLPDWQLDQLHVFAEWPANAPKHGLIHLLVNSLSEFDYVK